MVNHQHNIQKFSEESLTGRYYCITLAPVMTIFPETKISSTIFGCFMRYINPGNSSGSYCTKKMKDDKYKEEY